MKRKESLELAKLIGDKVHNISLMSGMMAKGTSGREACLLDLRKSSGNMVSVLATKADKKEVQTTLEVLENNIRASIVLGLINEKDGEDYMNLMTKLWDSIEKEK